MTATPYNFQKPGPLASAQEQQFSGWLRQACALATRIWQKQLPGELSVEYRGCEALRAADALQALPDGVLGWRVLLHERLTTVMIWPRPLTLGVVAGLLGDLIAELPADRDMTAVEDSLFEFFLHEQLLPKFLETWTGRVPLRPVLDAKEPHPRWLRVYEQDESLMVTTLALTGPFGAHEWRDLAVAEESAAVQRRLQVLVREMPVEITVKLGTAQLPLAQLAHLQAGDLIVLDQRINQPLKASVAGRDKLSGWPGRQGNRQVLQIDRIEA
jgi:flagellar motor switch protein FliM